MKNRNYKSNSKTSKNTGLYNIVCSSCHRAVPRAYIRKCEYCGRETCSSCSGEYLDPGTGERVFLCNLCAAESRAERVQPPEAEKQACMHCGTETAGVCAYCGKPVCPACGQHAERPGVKGSMIIYCHTCEPEHYKQLARVKAFKKIDMAQRDYAREHGKDRTGA